MNDRKIIIEGYFTLSNKILKFSDSISTRQKKKLSQGILKDDGTIHTILIGHLGKYISESEDKYGNTSLEGLLELAFAIIEEVNERIVCNTVLLECRDVSDDMEPDEQAQRKKLHEKYLNYGFSPLQKKDNLVQYIITI